MKSDQHIEVLREAAERRSSAFLAYQDSLVALNEAVREARATGMGVVAIAEVIGTTRQRVYEILREG